LSRFAEFRVAAAAESASAETMFGADTGTISITVFPELPEPVRPPQTDHEIDIAAMMLGTFPDQLPKDAVQLKAALRTNMEGVETRGGLLLPGKEGRSMVRSVPFNASAKAVLSASIRYYTSKAR